MIQFFKSGIYRKIALIFAIIICLTITVTFTINKYVLLRGFEQLEENEIKNNLDKLQNSITLYADNLNNICSDWASWDDTYAFIDNADPAYIASNFADPYSTMRPLNIDMIFFLNTRGEVIYYKNFDPESTLEEPVPEDLKSHFRPNSTFLDFSQSDINSPVNGIIQIETGIAIISSNPILTSTGSGPSKGALIMVSIMDDEITRMGTLVDKDFKLKISNGFNFSDKNSSISFLQEIFDQENIKSPISLKNLKVFDADSIVYYSDNTYRSFRLADDIFGAAKIVIDSEGTRDIYKYGLKEFRNLNIIVFLSSSIIVLLTLLIVNRSFLRRIATLSREVRLIGEGKIRRKDWQSGGSMKFPFLKKISI